MSMNIELPDDMEERIEEIQKDELYSSKSEAIRQAIREFISRHD